MEKGRPGLARSSSLGPFGPRVADELVAMLYDRNRSPALIGIPFGVLICLFAWTDGRHEWLLAWLAARVLTTGIRLALHASYHRSRMQATAATWGDRYRVALVLDALVWGLLVVLFADPRLELAPVMIAVVIAIGGFGAIVLSMDRRANTMFAAALFLPPALRILLLGTRLGLFGGTAMLLLFGLVVDYGVRSAEATRELVRLRFELAQARDAAIATGKAKGEFLATMSHELRTPLNAVIGMATLLADTPLSPDQRERLDVIRSSGETLLTLIGDILDISKIEAGKLEVESAPVTLARVVEEALDQVAPTAFGKGLELGYAIADGCPAAVISDPTRVRQILANLLGNAVKFTSAGSITVDVAAAARDGGHSEVTFAVHDTGIGIEPEALGRLFAPFTQADPTTTRRYGGTGLGLAICKSLSELLGGTIGVESAVGEGSTFHFSIVGKTLTQSRPRALPCNAGARVCIASEDQTARSLLARHVEGFGLVVSPVASLAAALEIVATQGSDLVLLDGRGSAEETTSAVRAVRAANAALPVLVVASPGAGPAGWSEPPEPLVATVSKPVKTGRLLEVIEALLAGQQVPTRASSMADVEPPPQSSATSGSVLVVDDNELNRRVALEMVRRLGLTAHAVASGAEAVAAVRGARFDYVLMDVQMPDMDGFEATRRVLDIAGARKPRVIAMTANALPGDRERCLAAGMSDYVTKPVRPAALAAALKQTYTADGDGRGERSGITDVLDAQVLEDLRMLEETSGATLIADLAASFRVDVPARIEEMRAAVRSSDVDGIRALAHRLRGSAGAVGANRVFLSATEIEALAASTGREALAAMVEQLSKESSRAIDAFDRVLERVKRERNAAPKD